MSAGRGGLCLFSPMCDHAWPLLSAPGPCLADGAEVPRAFPTDSRDLHAACQHGADQLQPGESACPRHPHPRQVTPRAVPSSSRMP